MSRRLKFKLSGFALLELLMAVAVVALGLSAALLVNTYARQNGELMNERMVALQDAHRVVELMRNASSTGNFPTNVVAAFPNAGAVAGYNNLTNEQVTVRYSNTTEDPLDITVTVGWRQQGIRNATTQLRTLMTQRQ